MYSSLFTNFKPSHIWEDFIDLLDSFFDLHQIIHSFWRLTENNNWGLGGHLSSFIEVLNSSCSLHSLFFLFHILHLNKICLQKVLQSTIIIDCSLQNLTSQFNRCVGSLDRRTGLFKCVSVRPVKPTEQQKLIAVLLELSYKTMQENLAALKEE